jgi:cytochrome c oxidase subunit 2
MRVAAPSRALLLASCGAMLAGCEGVQSVLNPYGPDAARIANLSWILFAGGTLILLFTLAAAALAVFGAEAPRRVIGSRRFVLAAGFAFPMVVLSALLVHTMMLARGINGPVFGGAPPLQIEVTGRQFWWEVRYPGTLPDGGVVTANEIRLPVGREVELRVASGDVVHNFWVPALHGKIDMYPGRVNLWRLRADRPGTFRGQCAEFCGTSHAYMAFYVVAEEPVEFERWLDRQRLPVEPPRDEFLALGMRVFGAGGCGGCHAVRGTEWNARIGPDLTHVGSRLSLAAGTLDNHRGTLAGWIAGSQHLKPGNGMPSFNTALDGPELRAVSTWLESLK